MWNRREMTLLIASLTDEQLRAFIAIANAEERARLEAAHLATVKDGKCARADHFHREAR